MKQREWHFVVLDLKKKSLFGPGLGEAPKPVPLASAETFLSFCSQVGSGGPVQDERSPVSWCNHRCFLPWGHLEGGHDHLGVSPACSPALHAVLHLPQIPDDSFWADSVTSSPNGEGKEPVFLKCSL